MIALLMKIIPTCFELCTSYDWRVMASKVSQARFMFSFVRFLAFHATIVWAWHVWSGHTQTTERVRYMKPRLQAATGLLRTIEVRLSLSLSTWST